MPIQTTVNDLKDLTNSFSYQNNGDSHEITYGDLIIDNFPNSEIFWKYFVTPITNRIDPKIVNSNERIRARETITKDIVDLSIIHYSVFLNLVYAGKCLIDKHFSYFENFYTHLGSVCDLAEEFVTQLYFVTLQCEEKQTDILQRLPQKKFMDLARDWYNKNYATSFEHYLSKGKVAPIQIIGRSNILDEYFAKANEWKEYSKLAQQIRTYRNIIVHNTQIGSHVTPIGVFVPKKNKITNYKKWHQVFSVNEKTFKRDFIERNQQMNDDLISMKTVLNGLWIKPIQGFDRLLYQEKNQLLLNKFDITG